MTLLVVGGEGWLCGSPHHSGHKEGGEGGWREEGVGKGREEGRGGEATFNADLAGAQPLVYVPVMGHKLHNICKHPAATLIALLIQTAVGHMTHSEQQSAE